MLFKKHLLYKYKIDLKRVISPIPCKSCIFWNKEVDRKVCVNMVIKMKKCKYGIKNIMELCCDINRRYNTGHYIYYIPNKINENIIKRK